ncbi:MAG: hypothetical protein Q7S95_03560, partial [bacterium]|nr:hypothetical protein [bacterium]
GVTNTSGNTLSFVDPGTSTSTLITLGSRQLLNASSSASVANLFLGLDAGSRITTGINNTGFGYRTLRGITSGARNTGVGANTFGSITATGNDNIAIGYNSFTFNDATSVTGSKNIGIGSYTFNGGAVSGSSNIGIGYNVFGGSTVSGTGNIVIGDFPFANGAASGSYNTTLGYAAGNNLASKAKQDTLIGGYAGNEAGASNQGTRNNVALGFQAGYRLDTGHDNILIGSHFSTTNVITSGSRNVGLGNELYFKSATANDQFNIGNLLFGTLPATTTAFALPTSGALGIGTSTPWGKFSISLNNTDTQTTAFVTASSTDSATTTLFAVSNAGNVGIGTTTPTIPLQVTTTSGNATTSVEVGKVGQTKGSCLVMYDAAGTKQYVSIIGGVFVFSSTSCS